MKWVVVENGPWKLRPSIAAPVGVCITYHEGGKSEVVASETLADAEKLRDALTEFIDAQRAEVAS